MALAGRATIVHNLAELLVLLMVDDLCSATYALIPYQEVEPCHAIDRQLFKGAESADMSGILIHGAARRGTRVNCFGHFKCVPHDMMIAQTGTRKR